MLGRAGGEEECRPWRCIPGLRRPLEKSCEGAGVDYVEEDNPELPAPIQD